MYCKNQKMKREIYTVYSDRLQDIKDDLALFSILHAKVTFSCT
jgi:hypothetical protein